LIALKNIFRQYGLRGLYHGTKPTILRDSLACGIYFSSYAWIMKHFLKPGQTKDDLRISLIFVIGSISGIFYWITCFPVDVMKTKMQTDNLQNPQYKSAIDCARKTYNKVGLKGFFNGFAPCMLRAVPVNGGVFALYEMLFRLITGKTVFLS